jgi:N-acetyl-alpha-D-muramate 1-phosphate uridylyltransferase
MDAFVFAAGLGTRLAPLTADRPKALVEVGGVALLERVARRLVAARATRIVVNACPFADDIEAFLRERDGFGVEVVVAREATPLETGGGLLAAAPLLRRDRPLLLHNVDVLSEVPLDALVAAHAASGATATLAVMERPTARRLLFDDVGLCGRLDARTGLRIEARRPVGRVVERAFSGIHVIDPRVVDRFTERGAFSILDPYLRLAGRGERIVPFDASGFAWSDVGRRADLDRAERALAAQGAMRTS